MMMMHVILLHCFYSQVHRQCKCTLMIVFYQRSILLFLVFLDTVFWSVTKFPSVFKQLTDYIIAKIRKRISCITTVCVA